MKRVTQALLRRWPLPKPGARASKEDRGSVLIVGGSAQMPGAVILAAQGALRAGAGKLSVATARSVAVSVAHALPEARVIALPEKRGVITKASAGVLQEVIADVDAVLYGPGMQDRREVGRLLGAVDWRDRAVVFDAEAIAALGERDFPFTTQMVLTPHAGEMAALTHQSRERIERAPQKFASKTAAELGVVIALKGKQTVIATPSGECWGSSTGNPGLATSGSGDVLAGAIAGLMARGATAAQAAVWASHAHGLAGEALARRIAPLGYLARELLAELPRLLCT